MAQDEPRAQERHAAECLDTALQRRVPLHPFCCLCLGHSAHNSPALSSPGVSDPHHTCTGRFVLAEAHIQRGAARLSLWTRGHSDSGYW
eukprot:scaffold437810_cov47-Prasinocladus_malaysianus.AAC.1